MGKVDHTVQSWVPFNLLDELEAGMTFGILKKFSIQSLSNGDFSNAEYSYNRSSIFNKTITSFEPAPNLHTPDYTKDYPLLFSNRLTSQYPNLKSIANLNDRGVLGLRDQDRFDPNSYSTNACNFNRINLANNLLIQVTIGGSPPIDLFNPGTNTKSSENPAGAVICQIDCYTTSNTNPTDWPPGPASGTPAASLSFNVIGAYLVSEAETSEKTWLLALELQDIPYTVGGLTYVSQRAAFAGIQLLSNNGDITNISVITVNNAPSGFGGASDH